MANKVRSLLRNVLGPTAFTVGTTAVKIVDLSSVTFGGESQVAIENTATFAIFFCYSVPTTGTPAGTPQLTTTNGVSIPAGAVLLLDDIGGMQVWAIAGTPSANVRVTGAY